MDRIDNALLKPRASDNHPAQQLAAEDRAYDAFMDPLRANLDVALISGLMTRKSYPLRSFLGECSNDAQKLLFAACAVAVRDNHPNVQSESDKSVAAALREFVETSETPIVAEATVASIVRASLAYVADFVHAGQWREGCRYYALPDAPLCFIAELAARHPVIDDAYGAREQPLDFIITTEGTLRDGVHDDTVAHLDNILRQAVSDESFFGIMWRPDDGDDVFDERVWAKVNPNLGVSKSLEYMRERAARARMIPRELATFRTKQLNQRVNAAVQWIDIQQWDAGKEAIDVTKLRAMPCYAGLDLARKNDMSALALVFGTAGGTIDVLFRYWMPEEGLRDRGYRDRAPYVEWAKAGILTVTEGNVTDFRQIEADIAELHAQYDIRSLRYDPMHATDLALRLRDDHGIAVEEFLQTYRNYTPACSELDRLLAGAKIRHGGNPIARWNAKNATQRMGPSGNVMPCKLTSTGRIDGISALCMGIGSLVFSAPSANVGIDFF